MNILLINHYAGSLELGMEFRPYYMAKEWVKMGHQVLIIGGSFSHLRKVQPEGEGSLIEGICYRWVKLNTYKGNGIGRIRSMFSFVGKLWWGYKKYIGDFEPDVVIASSTYPLDIYPARRIAKKYGAKLIYEVHDLWPLSPMELGGYSKWHPFIMVMQRAENFAYKNCDRIVSLLPDALKHMVDHGLKKEKFVYVPNGFEPSEWEYTNEISAEYKCFFEELKTKGKKILGYTGGHAQSNALDYLLDAMKLVLDTNVVCVLVGNGQEKGNLVRRVKEERIDNVFFLDPVVKNEIPSLLAQMDVLYIGWENNPLYRFGISPNKLIDYMMSGKPILHSVNASNDWVKEYDCGVSVPAELPEKIAIGIKFIFSLTNDELRIMGQRGQSFAIENLNYSYLAQKFISGIDIKI